MANTLLLDPNGIYDDGAVLLPLDLTSASLARARREGGLQYVRVGRRILYRGSWLLEWMERDSINRRGAANAS
jgi:hypothetical protein